MPLLFVMVMERKLGDMDTIDSFLSYLSVSTFSERRRDAAQVTMSLSHSRVDVSQSSPDVFQSFS